MSLKSGGQQETGMEGTETERQKWHAIYRMVNYGLHTHGHIKHNIQMKGSTDIPNNCTSLQHLKNK